MTKTTILLDTLKFPESPRWHKGKLWCSDLYTQQIVKIDLNGNVETVVELSDTPTAIDWTPEGHLLIVSANSRQLLRREGDTLVVVADLSEWVRYPMNDMVVDKQGRAYIGNLGYDFGNDEAAPQLAPILLVTPDGNAQIVADGLAFPNGLLITPSGLTLIVAESHGARLTAFDIASDGSLSNKRVWAQFENSDASPENQFAPDGMSLDVEGAVWVASPSTCEIVRVREGGEITDRLSLDNIPLACMLGGVDRRTLFIATTGSFDPSDPNAKGRIETIQVDVTGAGRP